MQGNVVLVTGASGGVGQAVVAELSSAGAEVILLGRSRARLQAAVADGHRGELLEADLTDADAIATVARRLAQRGRLDALILSSGIYERSDSPEMFRQQMEANVLGPYALLQALLPVLLQSQGQIIFVNSSQALRAGATVGQYAATMHAAKAVADSLRDEVNERGVRVVTLYLGRTAGERQRRIFELEGRSYPPDRLIQPTDVAQTVKYLLQLPKTVEVTDIMMRPMKKT
ncbi:MAG TPA: SDR family NAD(P)-dependent oxidoreductase [Rhodopila sp.]